MATERIKRKKSHELRGQSDWRGDDEITSRGTLGDYLTLLRRRYPTVLAALAVSLLAGAAVTALTRPTYQATAQVLVEGPRTDISTVDVASPLSDVLNIGQEPSLDTHVKLLQSEQLQERVAALLRIPVRRLPRITVDAVKDTDLIEVSAEDRSPKRAAEVANILVDTYLGEQREARMGDLQRALRVTSVQAAQAQAVLEKAEGSLRDFKLKHHIAALEQSRDAETRYVEGLAAERDKAKADLAANQAALQTLQRQLAQQPRTVSEVVSAVSDPAVQSLQSHIADLQAQDAALATTYRPDYFKRAPLIAQIAALQKQLLLQRASFQARNQHRNADYLALKNRIDALAVSGGVLAVQARDTDAELTQARADLAAYISWEVEVHGMRRAIDMARANDQTLAQKQETLSLRLQTPHINVRTVEAAEPPKHPVRPSKVQNYTFAFVLGLCLACGLALWQDQRDDRAGSAAEALRLLRLPLIGRVPALAVLPTMDQVMPLTPLADAYRELSTAIDFCAAAAGNTAPIVAVTLSGRGEGRSTTVSYLASVAAMDGRRVLVVDADLRTPHQHNVFGCAERPGLVNYLQGRRGLYDVIYPTEAPGVCVIPAGSPAANPAALLRSRTMPAFLTAIRPMADLILIDLPSGASGVDAPVVATLADGVVLVVDPGLSRRPALLTVREALKRAHAHTLGVVLNRTPNGEAAAESPWTPGPLPARAPALSVSQPGSSILLADKTIRMVRLPGLLSAADPDDTDGEAHRHGSRRDTERQSH